MESKYEENAQQEADKAQKDEEKGEQRKPFTDQKLINAVTSLTEAESKLGVSRN
ncbi:hypothetical protein PDN74_23145 [Bacillus cereus]|nr:hypothetical protein [Bacillus cereus]